jgi:Shedu protein SduA, C-terminal
LKDWGRDLQHAFSQVSDWSWAKNDNQQSALYKNAFGLEHFSETYLVVCGRTAFLDATEVARLHWRSEKTMIASCHILFWTYDDFHVQASAALDVWRALRSEGIA